MTFDQSQFELLRDELSEAGHRALPHFGARHADDDGVVRLDHDPGIDLIRVARFGVRSVGAEGELEADSEPAPAALLPTTNERRSIFGMYVMAVSPSRVGRSVNCCAHCGDRFRSGRCW